MKSLRSSSFLVLAFLFIISYNVCNAAKAKKNQQEKTYIVHMDKSIMPTTYNDHSEWYVSSLETVSQPKNMIYSYNEVVHGFSARLTPKQAMLLNSQPGVLSVVEEIKYELHTTRTPLFLGLEPGNSVLPDAKSVSDVIIGLLDTGVWPESKSYDDTELGSVPSAWKGECETGTNFTSSNCNKKLIGARFFSKGYESAYGPIDESVEFRSSRDDDGHGTHTSTTAAGSAVREANLFGFASGTSRGMAETARIAAYKVCWQGGCFGSDILAGMDKAVQDGVHVLSLSLGGGVSNYDKDNVAIGAFGAMEKGILVSCSAGNSGPKSMTLSNVAPWITTVGASTLDRDFPAYVSLGNGKKFSGVSLYGGKALSDTLIPIIYAANASSTLDGNLCKPESLNSTIVAGKIVICDRGENPRVQKGMEVKRAGGLGMILTNTGLYGEEPLAETHIIPTAAVGQSAAYLIKKYASSDSDPKGTIFSGGTLLDVQPSPKVASFSSRGPNPITPEILKPDLIAPGVNVLAGWTRTVGPSGLPKDDRRVNFNIISGTSMSCPHVSGLAALVKGAHPEWSPSAIRSALMTTAYTTTKNGKTIDDVFDGQSTTPFDYGAGHVNPILALDPGLVYDAKVDDYLDFLCASNYTSAQIKVIGKQDYTCDKGKKYSLGDLNYPSFAITFETSSKNSSGFVFMYARTLTNVGTSGTYKASVSSEAKDVKIIVKPKVLTFSQSNEKKTYTVTFAGSSKPSGTTSFARLEWSDGKHIVGSPMAFSWS